MKTTAKGSMYERTPGVWLLRVSMGADPATGKYRTVSRTIHGSKTDAKTALAAFATEVDKGEVAEREDKRLTLAAYIETFLAGHALNVSARTVQGYREKLAYATAKIGKLRLSKVTPGDLRRLYAELVAGGGHGGRALSPQTVKHVHRALFTALDRAVKDGLLTRNPAAAVDPPRVERPEISVLDSPAAAEQLIAHGSRHRHYPALLLALTTGLRRGEIAALRWRDIDFTRGVLKVTRAVEETKEVGPDGKRRTVLRIKPPKTRKGQRAVTLAPTVVEALIEHRRRQTEELLQTGARPTEDFVMLDTINGSMTSPNAISQWFAHLARRVGVSVSFHGLRHSHVTALLAAGVPVKAVSERAGHSSVSVTTDVYGHVVDAMGAAAAAATETWLASVPKGSVQNDVQNRRPKRRAGVVVRYPKAN
jgi:integrase